MDVTRSATWLEKSLALALRERLSELMPLLHVRRGRGQRTLRHADHLRADADASLVQRLDRDLVPLTHRAQHVCRGHLDSVEDELRGARGADAELVLLLAHGEPLELPLDDERRDPL